MLIRKDLFLKMQNRQVTLLKSCPTWKEMRKSFKTFDFKAQVHSQKEAWKWEAMAVSGTLHFLWKKSSNRKSL